MVLKLQQKITKLKKKIKSKNTKVQEVSSSSSSNEEAKDSSSHESTQAKRGNGKKRERLSLHTTLPPSIMIACLQTIPSPSCSPARRPILMG
jgi:predicted  nucleic acid-binding Zn-ribbon protein